MLFQNLELTILIAATLGIAKDCLVSKNEQDICAEIDERVDPLVSVRHRFIIGPRGNRTKSEVLLPVDAVSTKMAILFWL